MRILFFAQLKTAAHCATAELPLDGEIDATTLWQRLLATNTSKETKTPPSS